MEQSNCGSIANTIIISYHKANGIFQNFFVIYFLIMETSLKCQPDMYDSSDGTYVIDVQCIIVLVDMWYCGIGHWLHYIIVLIVVVKLDILYCDKRKAG